MPTIEEINDDDTKDKKSVDERYDDLVTKMAETKKQWDVDRKENDEEEDDSDKLLQQAIDFALQQGKGWAPGEKEAYLEKILDDDYIPPLFAETAEELEKSGLAEAFTSLKYDDSATRLMLDFKKKGNDSFGFGRKNVVKNMQYFRDAINHYYEAFAWAKKIQPVQPGDLKSADTDDPTYTEQELDEIKSTLCGNAALAHMQLKNWGYVRDESNKALSFNKKNVKAWYRLAKAYQMLQLWEEAGDAIDSGLAIEGEEENKDLKKLQRLLAEKVKKARQLRQQRERNRATRVANIKKVWKHCKKIGVRLGRVPLVSSVTDDDDEEDETQEESRWHHHRPNTGVLPEPQQHQSLSEEWSWPCMFLYPSHQQSDFIKSFSESEMLAMRMAEIFPELEDDGSGETSMPWDYKNEFTCSQLAVYVEVHCSTDENLIHPENVELLRDQGSAMRFYEATRALLGDEGPEMAEVIKAVERKHLYKQRKAWKKKHGSLWAKPDPCPVIRVHPAATLQQVLTHKQMVVPNFLVTFLLFPENHPAHKAFLKERKCIEVIQPSNLG